MTPGKYEELAMRTQASQYEILKRLNMIHSAEMVQIIQLRNGVTGLSDEVGELNSAVKKYVEYGQPLDIANIQEEVGDCLWRLVQICQAIGYSLEQAMIHNIQKLKVRYPDGFTDYQAAEGNRNREAERQLLEEPLNYPQYTYQVKDGKRKPVLTNPQVVTNQGFAEPPDETDVSFGNGTTRGRPLDSSYNRYCSQCHKKPVHRHNSTGICPDCTVEIRAGRQLNVQEELNRKVEESVIDPPVDGRYSGQTC